MEPLTERVLRPSNTEEGEDEDEDSALGVDGVYYISASTTIDGSVERKAESNDPFFDSFESLLPRDTAEEMLRPPNEWRGQTQRTEHERVVGGAHAGGGAPVLRRRRAGSEPSYSHRHY